jgi:hypothetical protein
MTQEQLEEMMQQAGQSQAENGREFQISLEQKEGGSSGEKQQQCARFGPLHPTDVPMPDSYLPPWPEVFCVASSLHASWLAGTAQAACGRGYHSIQQCMQCRGVL